MLLSKAMHWDFALILAVLGVAVPWLGRRRVRQLMQMPETTKMDRLTLYASTAAFQWLAAGVILWRASAHGIHARQLGVAIPNPPLVTAVAILLAALVFASQVFSLRRLVAQPREIKGLLPQLALKLFPQDTVERLAFLAFVVTVAVCEELIYRGFIQSLLQSWSGGYWLAGVLGAAAFFGLAHLYQGRRGLLTTFAIGALFSLIRVFTQSLIPCFAAHFVADLTVGYLAPARLRAALASASQVREVLPTRASQ
jgi:membrane protease YdiL (CAAX protease family)